MNGLQFFVHNDPDAVRVELAGSLCGADVETLHRAWQRVALPDAMKPVIVDITFVTDADERGRALLVVMHCFGARIIAHSPASSAIAQPIVTEPIKAARSKQGWLHRLIRFLLRERPAGAALPAQAEILNHASARSGHACTEYTRLDDLRALEDALR